MYIMTLMRTFFMDCVPLFIVLTGYLMNRKTLTKKYYFGIKNTLETYILASIACTIYSVIFQDAEFSIRSFVGDVLSYHAAPYSWYIEMYLGLFLLIPFLNILYNGLPGKKEKRVLLATLIIMVAAPGVLNIKYKLIPDWWFDLYPIMYYFIGCYLCEYKVKMKRSLNIVLLVAHIIVAGSLNYYLSYGDMLQWKYWQHYGSIINLITTVLLFVLVTGIRTDGWNLKIKGILKYLSGLCLGAYLCSYIADSIVYEPFNKLVPVVQNRVYYFIPIVILVLILSVIFSAIVDICSKGIDFGIQKIKTIRK